MQRASLSKRHQFFSYRAGGFGLGEGGLNPPMADEGANHIGQHGVPV